MASLLSPMVLVLSVGLFAEPPSDFVPPSNSQTGGGSTGQQPFWQPPSGAQVDPSTRGEPGFTSSRRAGNIDKTYRSTSREAPALGQQRQGYDILPGFGGHTSVTGSGGVPEYHVVQEGETLWGICELYFHDPYMWPQLWAFNEQITNAHWIFPGDRVRLQGANDLEDRGLQTMAFQIKEGEDEARAPEGASYVLNRFAYLEDDELEKAIRISGGDDAKVMMSTGDLVYLDYDPQEPPIPGERLSVYMPQESIRNLKYRGRKQRVVRGRKIGFLVEVVGEVEVRKVAEKTAEARIVNSIRPIERGMRVGELKTRFSRIRPKDVEGEISGAIVKIARSHTFGGENQFAIVNLGSDDGVEVGSMLKVVRMGDEYSDDHRFMNPYDKGHPKRVVGHLVLVQVNERTALGAVVDSTRELMRGDHIEN